eukprot:620973-Alexandrium_andersonii.AAC.1
MGPAQPASFTLHTDQGARRRKGEGADVASGRAPITRIRCLSLRMNDPSPAERRNPMAKYAN